MCQVIRPQGQGNWSSSIHPNQDYLDCTAKIPRPRSKGFQNENWTTRWAAPFLWNGGTLLAVLCRLATPLCASAGRVQAQEAQSIWLKVLKDTVGPLKYPQRC